jgi:hypothetical protein
MKRILLILGAIVATVALCGCAPEGSLFSLYSRDDQAFEEQLLGEWKLQDGADAKPDGDFAPMVFRRGADGLRYEVTISNFDGKGLTVVSTARLVRMGDVLFIDFGPRDLEEVDPIPARVPFPSLEIHFLGRIRFEGNQAHLDFLDDSWTSKQAAAGQLLLPTIETADGLVIAAKTEELRKFALAHAEDDEAFSNKFVLTRTEPAAPSE